MDQNIWERYYTYGCVSLAQRRFGEAIRDFKKALIQAERLSDRGLIARTRGQLVLALHQAGKQAQRQLQAHGSTRQPQAAMDMSVTEFPFSPADSDAPIVHQLAVTPVLW